MAGQLVGGAFFSAFLQVAFDRLATPEVIDFLGDWEIDQDDVENLKRTLTMIQAFADEAEVEQFTNKNVKLWLNHAKQLLYDADDILDEIVHEIRRVQLESESQVCNPLSFTPPSSDSIFPSWINSGIESAVKTFDELKDVPHKLLGNKEYGSKIKKINEKLNGVAEEGFKLGLGSITRAGTSRSTVFGQRPVTGSLVNKNNVFGRENEKRKIIDLLKDETTPSDINFSVLPIVGMGGLGKTTLAQLAYTDEFIRNHFDIRAWVCVGVEFDIVRITKDILQSIDNKKPESDLLDGLQNQLQEKLSKKKFLLVLDDVWNLDLTLIRWDNLQTPFGAGARGSKILVTTRDHKVSSIMRNVTPHQLEPLSDEACINLLRKHAFVDGNSQDVDEKLKMFGSKIVEKCKGLPLAVKTIAGLLRDRTEDGQWEAILKDKIWHIEEGRNEILPSLMLSYLHLPPHLKRCFAYCALFPKDYIFDRIELIRLWMAEGFVQPKGTKRLEDIGAGYFDDLFMRSFFDLSNLHSNVLDLHFRSDFPYGKLPRCFAIKSFSESSNISGSSMFVMHDLIHNLAEFVSAKICFRKEGDYLSKILTTPRHLSFDYNRLYGLTNFGDIKKVKSLRTLLIYGRNSYGGLNWGIPTTHQFTHQFLRVLCLAGCSNRELPRSIGNLKHLRLLDLKGSGILSLPDSITSLYNLQTLILSKCYLLGDLPKDMGDLVNLRHLVLPGLCKPEMSLRIGCLTNLQTLNELSVGLHTKIGELRDLSQLRGTLRISNLEKVSKNNGTKEAMEANLKNKPHLRQLELSWSYYENKNMFSGSRDAKVEENVLDQLQSHTNLEMLMICHYGGTRFPSWVGHPSFSNLAVVVLHGCHNCILLPSLRQLPSLKHLMISAMNISGSHELCGDDGLSVNKQFRSLETLVIVDMTEWEEWEEVVEEEFPCLHNLVVRKCPKLRRFSHHFSCLVTLIIENCNELKQIPLLAPSLQQLEIRSCEKLAVFPRVPSIQKLSLNNCHQLTTLSDNSQHPSSSSSDGEAYQFGGLRDLYIFDCPNMRKLPHGTFTSLVNLEMQNCKELPFLPMLPSIKLLVLKFVQCNEMVLENVSDLSSLSSLHMEGNSNLSSLPNEFFQHLTKLQQLEIHDFNELMMMVGLQHLTSLEHLVISKCPKLVSLTNNEEEEDGHQGLLPSSLKYLSLFYCDNLKKLARSLCNLRFLTEVLIEGPTRLACLLKELELHTLTSLHKLTISNCPSFVSLVEMKLPLGLQLLYIRDCSNLRSVPDELHKVALRNLNIVRCPSLVSLAEMKLPIGLQLLDISNCSNLRSLPDELHKVTSLQNLRIFSCPSLVSLAEMKLPIGLQSLDIRDCNNLRSLPDELHTVTSLQRLSISYCPSLVSLAKMKLPIGLQFLYLENCNNLKSLPDELYSLTSLVELKIEECPILEFFPDMGLPTALWKVRIQNCEKLNSPPKGLYKLTNLKELEIGRCSFLTKCKNIESLQNLTSLSYLSIDGCSTLKSIPKGLLPTCLEKFHIKNCPILESLHAGLSDLTFLMELFIQNCPIIKQQCEKKEGEDQWSNITPYAEVIIGGEWQ
ncbi:hypothetical protein NE237_022616 [Protea cynaroides]|uniref:Uncharacterized protein n=1 Tax=Protea cynaroides TaxID=273540 RepID=A0A9Q0HA39_9MAGN|nr:hypothetical protein NE237_022616 [Protea cynaroides]